MPVVYYKLWLILKELQCQKLRIIFSKSLASFQITEDVNIICVLVDTRIHHVTTRD